ncbi:MAG: (2Fe-2S)-binding protein [Firmicutes bacterium]|nr:(2Fe-2S)-binding protein [Bacillota bacterium]
MNPAVHPDETLYEVEVVVNGERHVRRVEARRTLADFLREELGLTGTHIGCEHGVCGACTVLLDGRAVRSCLVYAVQADGADVVTVEGVGGQLPRGRRVTLEDGREVVLNPLQEAFQEHHALQCGYCTPGFLISALELLRENPDPTEDEVRRALSGNLCRCTGYQNIVDAVLDAARRLRAAGGGPA